MGDRLDDPVGERWDDTAVDLPDGPWRNVFGGGVSGDLGDLMAGLPVAVLTRA